MNKITITDLYLRCSDLPAETRIVVFEDYKSYSLDTAPIFDGEYDEMDADLAFANVARFRLEKNTLFVELDEEVA